MQIESININFVNVYIIDRSTERDNNDIAVYTTCPWIYWHLYYCSTDSELPHTTMYMNSSYYLSKFEKNTCNIIQLIFFKHLANETCTCVKLCIHFEKMYVLIAYITSAN